jgi:hypothetical protein
MFNAIYNKENHKWFPKFIEDDCTDDTDDETTDTTMGDNMSDDGVKCSKTAELNKKIANKIFDMLKLYGIEVDSNATQFGNGYFIFEMGDNSVVHFDIKGFWLKDYRFGMWIESDRLENDSTYTDHNGHTHIRPVVHFFAQHKDYINKFKPSASDISIEINKTSVKELLDMDFSKFDKQFATLETIFRPNVVDMPYDFWDMIECIYFMKYHPCITFAGALCGSIYSRVPRYGFLINFLYERTSFHITNMLKKIGHFLSYHWYFTKFKLLTLNSKINSIHIDDFNKSHEGLCTNYRYGIYIEFNHTASNEYVFEFINRWFPKQCFGINCDGSSFTDKLFELQEVVKFNNDKTNMTDFQCWSDKEAQRRVLELMKSHDYNIEKVPSKRVPLVLNEDGTIDMVRTYSRGRVINDTYDEVENILYNVKVKLPKSEYEKVKSALIQQNS